MNVEIIKIKQSGRNYKLENKVHLLGCGRKLLSSYNKEQEFVKYDKYSMWDYGIDMNSNNIIKHCI
jgi:hypothetical protein